MVLRSRSAEWPLRRSPDQHQRQRCHLLIPLARITYRPAQCGAFSCISGKLEGSDLETILKPARYDITVYQRATFRRRFKLPFDATGHTVESQIWSARRVKKLVQFNVEWIDQADGLFDLVADFSQTGTTIKNGNWDLMVIYPNGDRFYWVEGDVIFDPGYTEPTHA